MAAQICFFVIKNLFYVLCYDKIKLTGWIHNIVSREPSGTEHFITDIHGEYEAFSHVLRNGSGAVKKKNDDVFGHTLSHSDKKALATLIYYPREKMELIKKASQIWRTGIRLPCTGSLRCASRSPQNIRGQRCARRCRSINLLPLATFERYFLSEKATHAERKNPYYRRLEN